MRQRKVAIKQVSQIIIAKLWLTECGYRNLANRIYLMCPDLPFFLLHFTAIGVNNVLRDAVTRNTIWEKFSTCQAFQSGQLVLAFVSGPKGP